MARMAATSALDATGGNGGSALVRQPPMPAAPRAAGPGSGFAGQILGKIGNPLQNNPLQGNKAIGALEALMSGRMAAPVAPAVPPASGPTAGVGLPVPASAPPQASPSFTDAGTPAAVGRKTGGQTHPPTLGGISPGASGLLGSLYRGQLLG